MGSRKGMIISKTTSYPVADPGFPRVGTPTPKVRVPTHYLANFSPGNCIQMKEIGPEGGVPPWCPLVSHAAKQGGMTKSAHLDLGSRDC